MPLSASSEIAASARATFAGSTVCWSLTTVVGWKTARKRRRCVHHTYPDCRGRDEPTASGVSQTCCVRAFANSHHRTAIARSSRRSAPWPSRASRLRCARQDLDHRHRRCQAAWNQACGLASSVSVIEVLSRAAKSRCQAAWNQACAPMGGTILSDYLIQREAGYMGWFWDRSMRLDEGLGIS